MLPVNLMVSGSSVSNKLFEDEWMNSSRRKNRYMPVHLQPLAILSSQMQSIAVSVKMFS
jgi:hypothetical protein